MKNLRENTKRGISILGVLVLGVIIILVLSYFDISVKSVAESPTGQENFSYVGGVSRNLWNDYFREPLSYLWNEIWIELFWEPFVDNMERLRDGKPTDIELSLPTVNY
ncbi:MAG: hypothetical protein WD991_00630 [Candidatus Paceibacterota bacterium]